MRIPFCITLSHEMKCSLATLSLLLASAESFSPLSARAPCAFRPSPTRIVMQDNPLANFFGGGKKKPKKGGDLGMFRRGKMSAAFELAAFNLDVHELSKTVASSSGVHLIYRVA